MQPASANALNIGLTPDPKMHTRQLADLAAWVAANSTELLHENPLSQRDVREYWIQSKCRISRWNATLKMFGMDLREQSGQHNPWPALEILIQEIVVSEMLTRIVATVFLQHDEQQRTDELGGVAHGVFISHLESRNRVMRILLHGRAMNEVAFDRVNQLRCQIECWTDLFLSQVESRSAARTFAFKQQRVDDFAAEHSTGQTKAKQEPGVPMPRLDRQKLLRTSLARNLREMTGRYSANPDLNRKIAAGVIGCFIRDRFSPKEVPAASRLLWLEKSHGDTQNFLDDLFELEKAYSQKSA